MSQRVPILIGSKNDADKVAGAVSVLTSFGLEPEVFAGYSAHRTPDKVTEFCRGAKAAGYRGILTGAGMANHLSGTVAAHTRLPVFGIPLSGGPMGGESSLLATIDMPPGVPVATFGIDASANAALQLIRQLALDDPKLDRLLRSFIERGSNVRAPMPINCGKVSDTFMVDGTRWGYVSDRLSAFDYVLEDPIPGKGRVLAQMTRHWLTNTPLAAVMPNHLISRALDVPEWAVDYQEQMLPTVPYKMLMIECIVRGYIVGSAWKEYQRSGTMNGATMPEGMVLAQKLAQPTFTPSTKAAEGLHDENISVQQAADLVGSELAEEARQRSLELFDVGSAYAADRGIIILDTKFEFGIDPDSGKLVLCDEVFTPDSSRFVDAGTFREGEEPLSMDKQYVRDWLKNESGWDPTAEDPGTPPPLPAHVIAETARRYQEIQRRLTSEPAAA